MPKEIAQKRWTLTDDQGATYEVTAKTQHTARKLVAKMLPAGRIIEYITWVFA